jgi:predicted ATP-grasp superfamily ATP-dependent carboligase
MSEIHRVLLIAFSERFLAVTHCLAGASNFKVNVLAAAAENKSTRFSRHIQTFATLPSSKEDSVLIAAIVQHVRKIQATVLLPVDETAISLVIRNREQLAKEIALPLLPNIESMNLVMDKWAMAVHMVAKGIPTPATFLLSTLEKMQEEIGRLTFPVLVKPTVGAGGRGIRYFANNEQLDEFLSSDVAKSEKYIVQEFIAGHAVDCSVLCRNGEILAYTIQKPLTAKTGGFGYAKCLEFIKNANAFQITADLVSLLKWSGVAHVDMQFDEQKKNLMVLELNPRFWGTVRGSDAVGVNFPLLACISALDKEFPIPSYKLEKFYDKWESLQYWLGKIRGTRSEALPIRNTVWAYILKDPLPFLVSGMIKTSRKILRSKMKAL